ncbi:hypothetical protein ABGB16_32585 [Micromonospora sp. B11E3]|uniref:hypothetical protein n=1 Tax=Micromonospora sp. B11E3 TaxID=3153562 RepID=UPI00325E5D0F
MSRDLARRDARNDQQQRDEDTRAVPAGLAVHHHRAGRRLGHHDERRADPVAVVVEHRRVPVDRVTRERARAPLALVRRSSWPSERTSAPGRIRRPSAVTVPPRSRALRHPVQSRRIRQ